MSKHTPGPWSVNNQKSRPGRDLWVGGGQTAGFYQEIADIYIHHSHAEANARLIAAAPDLLDACKAALIELRDTENKIAAIETIKRAIAKAEGTGSC